ncbi:hypothetical protein ACOMHN_046984 [Nucella lapillus]
MAIPFGSLRPRHTTVLSRRDVVTVTQALSLVAEVSSGGVKGSVTFTQVSPDDPVTVTFSLSGPKMAEAVAWQLHTFRVDYDVSDRCVLTRLGPR